MSKNVTLPQIVAVALIDQERVLLVRRTAHRRWYPNLWDLPGGHVESGETETQAVVREVGEELGVAVAEPSGKPVSHLYDRSPDGIPILELSVWIVTDWCGTVINKSPREHRDLRWFRAHELPYLKLAHPEYVKLLSNALRGEV